MNVYEMDVLQTLCESPVDSQRQLAKSLGCSLGAVNQAIRSLTDSGYLSSESTPTDKALQIFESRAPRNAVILAAGFGMRMVPINLTIPKGLLEVKKLPLIEYLIQQLLDAGISDITIVVGFLKEKFDYLIDKYGVRLLVNPYYAQKNNLTSLALAADCISNTFIIPSDIWCEENPFLQRTLYSWYMITDRENPDSHIRMNRKRELVVSPKNLKGITLTGIAYILEKDAGELRNRLTEYASDPQYDQEFWETALIRNGKYSIPARIFDDRAFTEINTYEELRELDGDSGHLHSDALNIIANLFRTETDEITGIQVLKKGMTNRSFLFSVKGSRYIMRIPGEGTDQLINREEETSVFQAISGKGLCDDPVYINPCNGYKITRFLDGIRTADPFNREDITRCMRLLKQFHEMALTVNHSFDLFEKIEYYESLWNGAKSIYSDYNQTKANVLSLQKFINNQPKSWVLTHIDAVPDNFLFYQNNGKEKLQLTDWEYAGMQDPHLDLAMWSVYSYYDRSQVDQLIDIYFEGACPRQTRIKIYCYVAASGLLWSNWCEYKSTLGIEFGDYAMKQYRYAKDFYRYASKEGDLL